MLAGSQGCWGAPGFQGVQGCSSAQGGKRRRAGAWGEELSRRFTRSSAPSTLSGGASGPKSWSAARRRRRGAAAASGSELPVRIRPSKYLHDEAECSEDAATRNQRSPQPGQHNFVTPYCLQPPLKPEGLTTFRGSQVPTTFHPKKCPPQRRLQAERSSMGVCPLYPGSRTSLPLAPVQRFGDLAPHL